MHAAEKDLEKILQSILDELLKEGSSFSAKNLPGEKETMISDAFRDIPAHELGQEDMVTLMPADEVLVSKPVNLEAIKAMKATTPARIGIGRAGARMKTASLLKFLADHAVAQDAVFTDVSPEFLNRMNLFAVQSSAQDKEGFLTHPELGRRLSKEAIQIITQKCEKDIQVQIIVVDGLSSSAIEANIPDLLPALTQGLAVAGIKMGTPFFIRYGRVWVEDQVANLLNADMIISLIGERPGLGTAESLSAYMIYRPDETTVEADRTVISNIHKGGIPPAEAGAHLTDVIKQVLKAKASGVRLTQMG
ncbi:ethanolamine ammonia-lyase subunit EutC [Desulfitobacterium chlororespirans]|uniref:Ethanolamine ammonia-lyase small subunit n=1 Tax=Desulfitobacterium chlororespirans DSM 11544 TaxID=1121395 RepID=A0A1M7TDP3_9FIRM|nr:ethanolamine ammonia-lyase subunit EutC [Desulfitobacterium chlororespirans]SHN68869.1 Ethanolamine ammonia-lyase light chain [Desulfitobacterium chlororespirans DSM 11544]